LPSKGVNEVLGIVGVDVFDAKVINNEGERDVPGVVGEEAMGVFGLVVSMPVEVLDKAIIGEATGLG
jgi:hypothetical protein